MLIDRILSDKYDNSTGFQEFDQRNHAKGLILQS